MAANCNDSPVDEFASVPSDESPKQASHSLKPAFARSNSTPAIYHPTQVARAQLGNTCGAVFLSTEQTLCGHAFQQFPQRAHGSLSNLEALKTVQHDKIPQKEEHLESSTTDSPGRQSLRQSLAHLRVQTSPGVFQSLSQPSRPCPSARRLYTIPLSTRRLPDRDRDLRSILHDSARLKRDEDLHDMEPVNPVTSRKTVGWKQEDTGESGLNTDGSSDCLLYNEYRILDEASEEGGIIDPNSRVLRVRFASSENLRRVNHEDTSNYQVNALFLDPFLGLTVPITRQPTDVSDISTYIRPGAFSGHRDTLARIRIPANKRQKSYDNVDEHADSDSGSDLIVDAALGSSSDHRGSPVQVYASRDQVKFLSLNFGLRILQHVSFEDYKALRLVCRQWLDCLPPPKLPSVFQLPTEILHQIYVLLQPWDFDAARHTCRSWFLASMDQWLGHLMSKKAGCSTAFLSDIECLQERLQSRLSKTTNRPYMDNGTPSFVDAQVVVNEIDRHEWWILSKRLATESRLSAKWQGSGLCSTSGHSMSRLTVVQVVDFRTLSQNATRDDKIPPCFRISTCGKFLLVVTNIDVFVYGFEKSVSSLRPIVRLVAPAKVIDVSMDTSSQRFAVAGLLEGRIGILWELQDLLSTPSTEEPNSTTSGLLMNSTCNSTSCNTSSVQPASSNDENEITSSDMLGDCESDNESLRVCMDDSDSVVSASIRFCSSPAERSTITSTDDEQEIRPGFAAHLPIITKPTALYKNLGTLSDSPRSVSICPQRKCVAFGCKTGVELHWIDPSTGDKISRWLSLTAASDHLYFLPQRHVTGSGNKLRLISSAAGLARQKFDRHNSTPATLRFRTTSSSYGRTRSMTRLFFGSLPIPSLAVSQPIDDYSIPEEDEGQGILRTVDCDHFCVKPLSDGTHMLSTDPITGLLCLGSNAPLGGPSKLVRKVCMVPPDYVGMPQRSLVCYTAGQDLRWGVRVVAAYNDGSIILYDIPSDCFQRIRHVRSSPDVWDELSGVLGQSDLMMDVFMLTRSNTGASNPDATNFDEYFAGDQPADGSAISFRSLQIDGSLIYHTEVDVQDLAVDCSNGGLALWIFCADGSATSMDICVPRYHTVRCQTVGVDGVLYDKTG